MDGETPSKSSDTVGVSIEQLLGLIQSARRAVPAVKYALGLVGIAAAAAIISIILGRDRTAIILVVMVFAGMVVLFVFSRASAVPAGSVRLAAAVLIWTVTVLFSIGLVAMLTAVTTGYPQVLANVLFPKDSEETRAELIADVATGGSLGEATDAIPKLTKMALQNPDDNDDIVRALKVAVAGTNQTERDVRNLAIEALMRIEKRNLSLVFSDELSNADFVGANFNSADLSGMSLENAFVVVSDFRDANLTDVDFSEASIRGDRFDEATLKGAKLDQADWFNATGVSREQLAQASRPILNCPQGFDHSVDPFVKYNDKYYKPFTSYNESYRRELIAIWQVYASPGGLCDYVASLSR